MHTLKRACVFVLVKQAGLFQSPLSMEFPRQEYWSGLPFPFSRDSILGVYYNSLSHSPFVDFLHCFFFFFFTIWSDAIIRTFMPVSLYICVNTHTHILWTNLNITWLFYPKSCQWLQNTCFPTFKATLAILFHLLAVWSAEGLYFMIVLIFIYLAKCKSVSVFDLVIDHWYYSY